MPRAHASRLAPELRGAPKARQRLPLPRARTTTAAPITLLPIEVADGLMPPDAQKGIQSLYFEGDMEAAPALAGQSAGLIDRVKTAQAIIDDTVAGFMAITQRPGGLVQGRHFG